MATCRHSHHFLATGPYNDPHTAPTVHVHIVALISEGVRNNFFIKWMQDKHASIMC